MPERAWSGRLIRPGGVYRRAARTQARRFGEDLVVLDGAGKTLRGLNRTGERVWELLDGSRSLEELARQLASERQADQAVVLEDVLAFVDVLSQRDLVEPSKEQP